MDVKERVEREVVQDHLDFEDPITQMYKERLGNLDIILIRDEGIRELARFLTSENRIGSGTEGVVFYQDCTFNRDTGILATRDTGNIIKIFYENDFAEELLIYSGIDRLEILSKKGRGLSSIDSINCHNAAYKKAPHLTFPINTVYISPGYRVIGYTLKYVIGEPVCWNELSKQEKATLKGVVEYADKQGDGNFIRTRKGVKVVDWHFYKNTNIWNPLTWFREL